jgi:hypothetical protein
VVAAGLALINSISMVFAFKVSALAFVFNPF